MPLTMPRIWQVIIGAIIVSSVCLALDSPRLDPASPLAHALGQLDLLWTGLFASELVVKVITFGFCCGEGAYIA